MEMFGTKYRWS